MPTFNSMNPTVNSSMSNGFSRTSARFADMPTVMKNKPNSRPLKGSMLASSSWRYSLSARRTPARNAPKDMDSPTWFTINAVPITTKSPAAVNASVTCVSATIRSMGRRT